MSIYIAIKQSLLKPIIKWRTRLLVYNRAQRAIHEIRHTLKKNKFEKLTRAEKKEAKLFFKSKGYWLKNTYWHQYNKGITGTFRKDFIPGDIFRSKITFKLNQMRQWPALMDKNLFTHIFHGFEQPKSVLSNINGFNFVNEEIVTIKEALKIILEIDKKLIIKPSIWTGQGKNVKAFHPKEFKESQKESILQKLVESYKKDFVIQEYVDQNEVMKQLNPSSLNTLRIMSYLNNDVVHILGSVVRIGQRGSNTDNFSTGGIVCGVHEDGNLKEYGLDRRGNKFFKTESGVILNDTKVPHFDDVQLFVKRLHERVPYFQIISWDIALNSQDKPVFIEYNTYTQDSKINQIANGSLFGEFTDEILALGKA